MIEKRYKIGDLEKLTKTNRRTIHFYIQLGLIPRPDSRGGAASYSEEALVRLNLIRELKKQRLTLEEIREFFEKERDKESETKIDKPDFFRNKNFISETSDNEKLNYLIIDESVDFQIRTDLLEKKLKKRDIVDESIVKIKITEGIELHINKEKYKKYRDYIKRGIMKLVETLAEKKPGRPKKEK